jgi:hypothetical protein
MTEIETLLSVDAGRVPPDTVAFFKLDTDRRRLRVSRVLAVLVAAATVGLAVYGVGRASIALLVLGTALLALRGTATLPAHPERAPTRQVMVITLDALIIRDDRGLRSWRFENLTAVTPCHAYGRPYLLLVDREGREHVIDHLSFQRSERFRQVIGSRLGLQV